MATSNSYNFSLNRNEIIKTALEEVSAADVFDEVEEEDIKLANRRLNMMVKAWQTRGISLPFIEEVIIFLPKNTSSLTLSNTGAEACLASDFIQTTTSASASSGASTITVASITGLASADRIGIKLSDGTRQWTTINGAPSGSTVTLTDALTGDVDSGATVYTYTSKIEKPMRLLDVRRSSTDNIDIPVEILARKDWNDLSDKTSDGTVTQVHYQPKNTNGILYIWQQTDDVDNYLKCTVEYPIEDFDSASDDCMFPSEWYEAMVYGLAWRLGTGGKFGVNDTEMANLKAIADEMFDKVNNFDQEYTYVDFVPNLTGEYS